MSATASVCIHCDATFLAGHDGDVCPECHERQARRWIYGTCPDCGPDGGYCSDRCEDVARVERNRQDEDRWSA